MTTFPLPGANWSYLHGLRLVATTGVNGFALQNGVPNILTWDVPNDGQMHRATIWAIKYIASAETGGHWGYTWALPNNMEAGYTLDTGSNAVGVFDVYAQPYNILLAPGTTLYIEQISALTAGASTVWAEIWAY